jgi:hypothetical protein
MAGRPGRPTPLRDHVSGGRAILTLVNRRLRLALFVAALVAAGPMPSARTVELARTTVGISWFRADVASRPQRQQTREALPIADAERLVFTPRRDPVLPDTLRSHSLFQRPPPLQS